MKNDKERIIFLSANDLFYGHFLLKCEDYIFSNKNPENINDIIEMYNVWQYSNGGTYLKKWDDNSISSFKDKAESYIKKVAVFFNEFSGEFLEKEYKQLEKEYRSDFWKLVEKFEVYEKISDATFEEFLKNTQVSLCDLLINKKIVKHFGSIIRKLMINYSLSAEILIDKYEIKSPFGQKNYFFPKELSCEDKEEIINKYVESETPNFNYLSLISRLRSDKNKIKISDKILLKARQRLKEQEKTILKGTSSSASITHPYKINLSFSENIEDEFLKEYINDDIKEYYSKKWIENNSDYPTLLNNFIFLFNYVDYHMRFNLVSKPNNIGVLERFARIHSENEYIDNIYFYVQDKLSLLQIHLYKQVLFNLGIRLENLIEWFFKVYLPSEFDIKGFKVIMPSENSTNMEKCNNIIPSLDSVLKQFALFVEEREIDYELLELRSDSFSYVNLQSFVKKKYAYGIGDEFKYVTYLFFSDQSGLGFSEKANRSYRNFFEFLKNESSKLIDYPNFHMPKLKWLIEKGYLYINEYDIIRISDMPLALTLEDLFYNDVISYWHYNEIGRKRINELQKKEMVEIKSSLFSKPEQDYISFFFDNSKFNNGFEIRNKYVHGHAVSLEENDHYWNYLVFLRTFFLTIIKINDDIISGIEEKNYLEKESRDNT